MKHSMLRRVSILLLFCVSISLVSAETRSFSYEGFLSPSGEARPSLRWWWNGDLLSRHELKRQLEVIKQAGFGGVEVESVPLPTSADSVEGLSACEWMSPEWIGYLQTAANEAKQRAMHVDLYLGGGRNLGEDPLRPEESVQRVITHRVSVEGQLSVEFDQDELYSLAMSLQPESGGEAGLHYRLLFAYWIPRTLTALSQIQDVTSEFSARMVTLTVPQEASELVYGYVQQGYRTMPSGVAGMDRSVVNPFDKEVVRRSLENVVLLTKESGKPLREIVRSLSMDGSGFGGANWTPEMESLFTQRYGYSPKPYYPYVFASPTLGYGRSKASTALMDSIARVRYDYNRLLVQLFDENLLQEFRHFCIQHGVKARFNAYASGDLLGGMDANRLVDEPETNSVLGVDVRPFAEKWGYDVANSSIPGHLMAASSGHLADRRVIRGGALLDRRSLFQLSLEELKRLTDMDFILGATQTHLYGYNYSPREAAFPGWIHSGSYLSEQNGWWSHFRKWSEYNARLAYIFQNARPVKKIAIVIPEGDVWSNKGLGRSALQSNSWYGFRLWEVISQLGYSCDYIPEKVVAEANVKSGRLHYGPMSYEAIFVDRAFSLRGETARALLEYAKGGGRLAFIEEFPDRSLSMVDAQNANGVVQESVNEIFEKYSTHLQSLSAPDQESELMSWTSQLLSDLKVEPDVRIANPSSDLYQIRYQTAGKDIYFFVNTNRFEELRVDCQFPTGGRSAWLWNAESGKRTLLPTRRSANELTLALRPLESLLVVFDSELSEGPSTESRVVKGSGVPIGSNWTLRFHHLNGSLFEMRTSEIKELGRSMIDRLRSFAGTVTYKTTFHSDGKGSVLSLGTLNRGVVEVVLNGRNLGTHWYGVPEYSIAGLLRRGTNHLEIRYTTLPINYALSQAEEGNATAQQWTQGVVRQRMGLESAPVIY